MKNLILLLCTLMLVIPVDIFAKPPPWAPAHGYRNKHKEKRSAPDIGIFDGRCNREVVGTILGGVLGGTVGSTVGKGDSRTAAIVAGALIGIFVGKAVGLTLDNADRYCTGQTFELAEDGHAVTWQNPATSLNYRITPIQSYMDEGRHCREYISEISSTGITKKGRGRACRLSDGTWEGFKF